MEPHTHFPRIAAAAILFLGIILGASFLSSSPSSLGVAALVPAECQRGALKNNINGCTICHLAVLVNNITDFLVEKVALPSAALLVLIGGFLIMTAGPSEERVKWGKSVLTHALIGLIIVLIAWLAVDTVIKVLTVGGKNLVSGASKFGVWNEINPSDCELSKTPIPDTGGATPPGGGLPPPGTGPPGTCQNCVPMTGLPVKTTGACSASQCQISSDTYAELVVFNQKMSADGITWIVNEAWPPTVTHANACHAAGTCIDAGIANRTAPTINATIAHAQSSGLTAQYEVPSGARRSELIAAGVNPNNVIVVQGINNEHFSIYNT